MKIKLLLKKPNTLNTLDRLYTLIFYLSILLFIIGFNFTDSPPPFGWYQQFMPNLNNQSISDIFFLDSLTGWACTGVNNGPGHINYILKTTNSGDNWNIVFTDTSYFSRIKFINSSTGFASGGSGGGTGYMYRSLNGGINWSRIGSPGTGENEDMAVLNQDSLWVVDSDQLVGGAFFTSNGGASWQRLYNVFSAQPNHIYMFNGNFGFISTFNTNYALLRTTNSGQTWTLIPGVDGFLDMHFVDSMTGWKCSPSGGFMKKTINGGFNWVTEILPYGGIIQTNGISSFSNINKDTIWGNGGYVLYPNNQVRGFLNRTTDGGNTWLFQIPDTSIHIFENYIEFKDRLIGWSYATVPTGIHTVTGGNDTFYTRLKQISSTVPGQFQLFQNFPNPFNGSSKFKVKISKLADVRVTVFDVTGKLITTIINQKLNAGTYELSFDGSNYSSGVYFYSLFVNGNIINTKRMMLLR